MKIIRSETELFAIADEQKKAEEKDLKSFPLSRSTKALSDLLENTWKMKSTSKKAFRSKQTATCPVSLESTVKKDVTCCDVV